MTATIRDLHPRRPATQGCLAKDEVRCPRPALWSLVLTCGDCGMRGDGPACGWHKVQADEWGIPHRRPDGQQCPNNAAITSAIPLR